MQAEEKAHVDGFSIEEEDWTVPVTIHGKTLRISPIDEIDEIDKLVESIDDPVDQLKEIAKHMNSKFECSVGIGAAQGYYQNLTDRAEKIRDFFTMKPSSSTTSGLTHDQSLPDADAPT